MNTSTRPHTSKRKPQLKRRLKITVDVLMLVLFLYLMSYHPGMGLMWHAIWGMTLLALFVVHHGLNFHWHTTLFSGKYNTRRALITTSDVLLVLAMGTVAVSSYKIASMALPFEFLPPPRHTWRDLHMVSTAWCFVLMAFHLGLHLHNTLDKWERSAKSKGRIATLSWYTLELAVLLTGALSLWHNNILHDLIMEPTRPMALPAAQFYGEYALILMGFCVITHLLLQLLQRGNKRAPRRVTTQTQHKP